MFKKYPADSGIFIFPVPRAGSSFPITRTFLMTGNSDWLDRGPGNGSARD
jgi:hypothetical protein